MLRGPSQIINPLAVPRHFGYGTGPSAGGGAAAQPEIFTVATVADVAGSLHGDYFTCSKAGQTIAAYISAPVYAQFTLNPADGTTCITASDGLSFEVYYNLTQYLCVWINTGTETTPTTGAAVVIEVGVSPTDTVSQVSAAIGTALIPYFNVNTGVSVALEAMVYGVVPGPAGSEPFTTAVDREGVAEATPPGGFDRTINVTIARGQSADDVAYTLQTVLDADADWNASRVGNLVTVTAAANGTRPDAADVSTGFTITVTQQGS